MKTKKLHFLALFFLFWQVSALIAQTIKPKRARVITNETTHLSLEELPVSQSQYFDRAATLNETFSTKVPPTGWAANDFLLSSTDQEGKATGANGKFAYYLATNREPGKSGTLTTPVLEPDANFDSLNFKVNYYVIDTNWKYNGAKLYIDFSQDLGKTWIEDNTNNILATLPNYNVSTTGWIEKTVDLSAFIGKKVIVRFRAVSDYGMANIGIDDVTGPNIWVPANDMSGKRYRISMNNLGYYQFIPASQLDSIEVRSQVTNNGTASQTNVRLKANFNNDISFETGFRNPTANFVAGKTDTMFVKAVPKEINDTTPINYGGRVWLEQNEADELPENNILDSVKFASTKQHYVRTTNWSGNYSTYGYSSSSISPKTGFEYGVLYFISKETKIDKITAFIPKHVGNGSIVAKLYVPTNSSASQFNLLASSDSVKPNQGPQNDFIDFNFKEPFLCPANAVIMAAIQINGDYGVTNQDTTLIAVDGNFLSSSGWSRQYINNNGTMGWYSLTQPPLIGLVLGNNCKYNLSDTSFTCSSADSTYAQAIAVSSNELCAWNAVVVEGSEWLSTSAKGFGNGQIVFSVAANKDTIARIGKIRVEDKIFAVVQQGVVCKQTLSVNSFNCPDNTAASYDKISLVASPEPCEWNAEVTSGQEWLTCTSSGKGNGDVNISVKANYAKDSRSGQIKINDVILDVTQPGYNANNCNYQLSQSVFNCDNNAANTYDSIASITADSICAWEAVSNDSWITTSSNGKGNGKIAIAVTENTSESARQGSVTVNGKNIIVAQPGVPVIVCSYAVDVTEYTCANNKDAVYSDIITVTPSDTSCEWTAISNNTWITAVSSGKGVGKITISVSENTSENERIGSVTVKDKNIIIKQPGVPKVVCSFIVDKETFNCADNKSADYTDFITVTPSDTSCEWNAVSNDNWITTTSSGKGTGKVSISVSENTSNDERVGSISVKDKTIVITQPGVPKVVCSYAVDKSSFACENNNAKDYNDAISVTAESGCAWSAVSNNSWITTTSSGEGNGKVSFSVSENTSKDERTGSISLKDKTIIITQPGKPEVVCSYNLSKTSFTCKDNSAASYDTIAVVNTDSSCAWSAVSNDSWITTTSSGKGEGVIAISVSENTSANQRNGSISIGNLTIAVIQPGADTTSCVFVPSTTLFKCVDNKESDNLKIAFIDTKETCSWTATVTDGSEWLSTSSAASGSADLIVKVLENKSTAERTGTIDVQGIIIKVVQPGVNCQYTLSSNAFTCDDYTAKDYNNIVDISTDALCSWTAVSSDTSWIKTTSSGQGNGSISISVTENTTGAKRVGEVKVEGKTIVISQPAKPEVVCSYTLSKSSFNCTDNQAKDYDDIATVSTDTACSWTAVSNDSWIATNSSGKGEGKISISVLKNTATTNRIGSIKVEGKTIVITQPGLVCSYALDKSTFTCADNSAKQYADISVISADGDCEWSAKSNDSWITTSSSGKGNGTISISVEENTSEAERIGSVNVEGKTITIIQPGKPKLVCTYTLSKNSFECADNKANEYKDIAEINADSACSWTAVSKDSWITTTSNGQGKGSLSISVEENKSKNVRTGSVEVEKQIIFITQPGMPEVVCSYTVSKSSFKCDDNKAKDYSNAIDVSTDTACSWTAKSNDSWISTSSSGKGNGSISFSVSENTSNDERSGSISVEGKTIIVTQPGKPAVTCTYTLSKEEFVCADNSAREFKDIATVSTDSNCSWTAVSNATWISTSSNGKGNGNISITVSENTSDKERTGTVTVNDKSITIKQPGAVLCTFTLSVDSFVCPNGNLGAYQKIASVNTQSNCNWSAKVTSGGSWLSTISSGKGNGDINISVTKNETDSFRIGTISVEGKIIKITQPPVGTGIADMNADKVLIYPNPANQFLNIQFNQNINGVIAVYSMNGKLVLSRVLNNQTSNIDISELNRGIYFYEITNDDKLNIRGKFSVVK